MKLFESAHWIMLKLGPCRLVVDIFNDCIGYPFAGSGSQAYIKVGRREFGVFYQEVSYLE